MHNTNTLTGWHTLAIDFSLPPLAPNSFLLVLIKVGPLLLRGDPLPLGGGQQGDGEDESRLQNKRAGKPFFSL